MRKRTIRAYVALALGFVLLPGCSGPIELAVTGEPMMNNGNPATVGIYQLSNNTRFMDATVTAFWAGDEEVLGDELVGTPQKLVVS
ncbi:MAG: hypothetical protein R3178_08995, partial [Rhodothermales bacterium]|nr:hypothetical protein [Rhodothermales bacterium]